MEEHSDSRDTNDCLSKSANGYSHGLILILIWYVAGSNFRYNCDGREVRTFELDGASGGSP